VPLARANEGIVPTRSRVWGQIRQAVQADHLEAIGHFNDADVQPPHFDWLPTGSGFDRRRFEALWDAVVQCMLAYGPAPVRVRGTVGGST
jgi:hypothetical protein